MNRERDEIVVRAINDVEQKKSFQRYECRKESSHNMLVSS